MTLTIEANHHYTTLVYSGSVRKLAYILYILYSFVIEEFKLISSVGLSVNPSPANVEYMVSSE